MDFDRLNSDIKEIRRRNRGLGIAVGVLAVGHLLALTVILNLVGSVRTVVVPPSINKSFWVSRDKASSEYLEQMGSFIAWLVLDVTPASTTGRRKSCSATWSRSSTARSRPSKRWRPNG